MKTIVDQSKNVSGKGITIIFNPAHVVYFCEENGELWVNGAEGFIRVQKGDARRKIAMELEDYWWQSDA